MAFIPTPLVLGKSSFAKCKTSNPTRNVVPAKVTMVTGRVAREMAPFVEGDVNLEYRNFIKKRADAPVSLDYEAVIAEAEKWMFGNSPVLAFERDDVSKAESYFVNGNITTKEFLRMLAKTSAWKGRYFDDKPLYSAVEVCYRRFRGATPITKEESLSKSALYHSGGYDAFIDEFFGQEYDNLWGVWNLPKWQTPAVKDAQLTLANYTDLFPVVRGVNAAADKALLRYKTPASGVIVDKSTGGSAATARLGAKARTVRIEVRALTGPGTTRKYTGAYSRFPRTNKAIFTTVGNMNKKVQEIVKNGGVITRISYN